jgi:HEAT repeat protein
MTQRSACAIISSDRNVRPWERLFEEIEAASHTPLAHTIRIPLNAPPFVRQAVIALDSASPDERKGAIETLAQAWNTTDAHGVLIEALKHPIADVGYNAAWALGRIKDPSTVPALTKALSDSDPNVRRNAAQALRNIR